MGLFAHRVRRTSVILEFGKKAGYTHQQKIFSKIRSPLSFQICQFTFSLVSRVIDMINKFTCIEDQRTRSTNKFRRYSEYDPERRATERPREFRAPRELFVLRVR